MSFSGDANDRLAIRELVDKYADAVCRRNADDWGSTWAEDSLWCVPEFPGLERVEGRDAIVTAWSAAMDTFTLNYMHQSPGEIIVSGTGGTGRIHNFEVGVDLEGNRSQHIGTYEDRYIKIDGQWLFAERLYTPRYNF